MYRWEGAQGVLENYKVAGVLGTLDSCPSQFSPGWSLAGALGPKASNCRARIQRPWPRVSHLRFPHTPGSCTVSSQILQLWESSPAPGRGQWQGLCAGMQVYTRYECTCV